MIDLRENGPEDRGIFLEEWASQNHVFSEPWQSCSGGSLNQQLTDGVLAGFSEPQANEVSPAR